MQVFIIGSPLETAMAMDGDVRRYNKQIVECQQILDALNGKKAWSNHPCTLQYRGYEEWLWMYKEVLYEYYLYAHNNNATEALKKDCFDLFAYWNNRIGGKKNNRNFIGIELDEEYFNIAEKRIKEAQQLLTFDF